MSTVFAPSPVPTPHRLADRTILISCPHGALLTVEPRHAEAVAERLARFLPRWAFGHVASGDYYLVTPKYAEAARLIVLVSTGTMLRLGAESYPAALARLAQHGRIARELVGVAA